jgi:hypothetical protein
VQPKLQAAEGNDALAPDAIAEALNWARNDQRCVQDHDVEQIVRLASLARIAALIGFDLGDVQDKLLRCTNFEVEFDSRIATSNHWVGDEEGRSYDLEALWQVKSTIPIDIRAVGTGPITWTAFSYEAQDNYNCGDNPLLTSHTKGIARADGTLTAALALDLTPRETPPGRPASPLRRRVTTTSSCSSRRRPRRPTASGTPAAPAPARPAPSSGG